MCGEQTRKANGPKRRKTKHPYYNIGSSSLSFDLPSLGIAGNSTILSLSTELTSFRSIPQDGTECTSALVTSFCREEVLSGSSNHVQEDEGWPWNDTCGSNLSCCRFCSAAGPERTWKLEGTQQLFPGDVGLGGGQLSVDSCSKADIKVLEAENNSPSAGKYAGRSASGPEGQVSYKAVSFLHLARPQPLWCCAA